MSDGTTHRYTNRLIDEASPYLLKHAHNPVDWYPWGEDALAKARAEDKPIFLSVGYASCHWCSVMEHESFEDPATADVMNRYFVNIKVDREERPDIDSIYMTAVVAMTGQGGWPLNVFLLPDGTPFFGGTYFPPDSKAARYRMQSFKQVLETIASTYANRRDDLVNAGNELLSHMQQQLEARTSSGAVTPALFDDVLQALMAAFDQRHGGFGRAPRFPQPMTLEFLLRLVHRDGNDAARGMLDMTLTRMAHGGMYDQLGGGFHRYSVDDHWLVPHFEKMLYDNALLARLYTEAWQVTGTPLYRRIAEETLDYMVREMLHPDGGFYSTQDADSAPAPGERPEEGAFFVWTAGEVREALGGDALLFSQLYGVTAGGNFEGKNILHLPRPLADVARVTGVDEQRLHAVAARGKHMLFALREQRSKPARDEKILTAWNGMALRAYAAAAAAFGRDDYLHVAQRNAAFVLHHLRRADGRVLRSWKDGQATIPGFLEDYALLVDGLLALYTVDGNADWLQAAVAHTDDMLRLFWDDEQGTFYDTATDQEQLVTRPRDSTDNATPSGTSVAADVLLRLAALLGNDGYHERAMQVLGGNATLMRRFPTGFGRMLCAADFALTPVREVALIGTPGNDDLHALQRELTTTYQPYVVVAYSDGGTPPVDTPLLANRPRVDGKATAYVCQQFTCQLPVTDAAALRAQLAG